MYVHMYLAHDHSMCQSETSLVTYVRTYIRTIGAVCSVVCLLLAVCAYVCPANCPTHSPAYLGTVDHDWEEDPVDELVKLCSSTVIGQFVHQVTCWRRRAGKTR